MSHTFPFDNAVVLGAGLMGRLVAKRYSASS